MRKECPGCKTLLDIPGEIKQLFGRKVTCPVCKTESLIGNYGLYEINQEALAAENDRKRNEYFEQLNKNTWIGIAGFAIGALIGIGSNKKDKK